MYKEQIAVFMQETTSSELTLSTAVFHRWVVASHGRFGKGFDFHSTWGVG
jgi:hypothetical protein